MPDQTQQFSFKVLTINIHKGFTAFNRRFILPELRDAVRTVSAAILPTAAMPYTRKGITATPYCRVIPLNIMRIAMFRSMVRKSAACSTAALCHR